MLTSRYGFDTLGKDALQKEHDAGNDQAHSNLRRGVVRGASKGPKNSQQGTRDVLKLGQLIRQRTASAGEISYKLDSKAQVFPYISKSFENSLLYYELPWIQKYKEFEEKKRGPHSNCILLGSKRQPALGTIHQNLGPGKDSSNIHALTSQICANLPSSPIQNMTMIKKQKQTDSTRGLHNASRNKRLALARATL